MNPSAFLRNASVVRLAFGVTGLVRPALLCRLSGMRDEHVTEETLFLIRVFATRDLVLAAKHLKAASDGEDAARDALAEAAVIGAMDGVAITCDVARRGEIRGGARAAAVFAVTDGIGFPLAHAFFKRGATSPVPDAAVPRPATTADARPLVTH